MRPSSRHFYLIALALLFVLVVGGVLFFPASLVGDKDKGRESARLGVTSTPTGVAVALRVEPSLAAGLRVVSTATSAVAATLPVENTPVGVAASVPTTAAVALPAMAAIPTAVLATTEAPPAPATSAPMLVPTSVPIPTDIAVQARSTERVGGPVTVPNLHKGPRWVTLQAGHWHNDQLPEELLHLSAHTGAYAAGVREVDLNVQVCKRAAQILYERGFSVDILDATVPVSYTTDLFLAVHADGSPRTQMRGFKAVAPWVSVPASDQFVGILYEEYGKATGLPADPVTSVAMADYYAFNPITYRHAITADVPAALIEMGFVTNPLDRQLMVAEQDRMALGIANAVDRFFRSGAAGDTPTPYPSFTPTITPTRTPTPTYTPTSTPSPTLTPTDTPTAVPTEMLPMFIETVAATTPLPPIPPSPTPRLPIATRTPLPTSTPITGTITTDGRWLPPLSPNGRDLPPPGSNARPVLLSEALDEQLMTADGRERQQVWQQVYVPELGRSVWRKGTLRYVRP